MVKFVDFSKLLKFIYGVTRLSGFLFVSIDFKSMTITNHFWNKVYFIASFGFSIGCYSYSSYVHLEKVTHSKLLEMGVNFIVRISVYSPLFLKAANAVHNRKLYDVIKGLTWCQSQMTSHEMKSMTKFEAIRTSSIFFIYNFVFVILFFGLSVVFRNVNVSLVFTNTIFFYSTIFFNLCLGSSLMMIIACGYQQLLILNSNLTSFIKNPKKKEIVEVIRKTSIFYDKICDIFDGISRFYLLVIMWFLMGFTYFFIFGIYATYIFFNIPEMSIFLFLLSTFLWLFYYAPCVLYMTVYSSWIQSEACRTADLIQILVNKENDLRSLKKASLLALLVTHRSPKINCGLFEVNWKTFFGIIGSIFSFSIILIQFYDVTKD